MQTPVVYNLFKRPIIVKTVLSRIRLARPKIVYLFSDGWRSDQESLLIRESREIALSLIDWDCDLKVFFLDKNKGPDMMTKFIFETVFSQFDRLIYLEEDMLPSLSFFPFCEELLEFYKNDDSIYLIGGMNFLEDYETISNYSYIFQNYTSTWGIALWKRTYERIDYNLKYLEDNYYNKLIKYKLKKSSLKFFRILINKLNSISVKEGELWLMGYNENLLNNSLAIVPSRNLVRNIGDSTGAENGDDRKLLSIFQRWVFDIIEREIEFPIKHQKLKIVDDLYFDLVKKRSYVGPLKLIVIKFERAFRILIFSGPLKLFQKIYLVLLSKK